MSQSPRAILERGPDGSVTRMLFPSRAEAELAWHIRALKLPTPQTEFRFHGKRKWRFDFAWPDVCLAVEVEGVTHEGGRHQRVQGFERDCEKYNEATLAGWRVLRFTQGQVKRGEAVAMIECALAVEAPA